jgi:hypothetical protein
LIRTVRLGDVEESRDDWVIQGMLTGLSILFGPSKSRKSFIALDWAVHVAAGKAWHGHQTRQGPVVYVAAEGGLVNVSRRAREAARHAGIPEAHLPLFMVPQAVSVRERAILDELEDRIDEIGIGEGKPVLIILDTLARCMTGNENQQEDMNGVIQACDELRERYGCCVLVVHHTPVSNGGRPRGSSSLYGAVDTAFLTKVDGRHADPVVSLTADKLKDLSTEEFEPGKLKFKDVVCRDHEGELILDCWGDRVTTQVLEPMDAGETSDRANQAAAAFASLARGRPKIQAVGWKEWHEASGLPATTFKRAIVSILDKVEEYSIVKRSRGHYCYLWNVEAVEVPGESWETDHDEVMRRKAAGED